MALNALLNAALKAVSGADSHLHQQAEGDEGRFFITGTGNPNQSLVVGNANMVLFGLVAGAFVIALVAAAFTGRGSGSLGYKSASPSSYESSYAVHRALEDTAKTHE